MEVSVAAFDNLGEEPSLESNTTAKVRTISVDITSQWDRFSVDFIIFYLGVFH